MNPDPTIIILDPGADFFVITKFVRSNFVIFTSQMITKFFATYWLG
jgi:hypothetical protein